MSDVTEAKLFGTLAASCCAYALLAREAEVLQDNLGACSLNMIRPCRYGSRHAVSCFVAGPFCRLLQRLQGGQVSSAHHGATPLAARSAATSGSMHSGSRRDNGTRAGDFGALASLCRNDPASACSLMGWRIQDQHACIHHRAARRNMSPSIVDWPRRCDSRADCRSRHIH